MLSLPTHRLRYIVGMLLFVTLCLQCTVHTVKQIPPSDAAQHAFSSSIAPYQGLMRHVPLNPTFNKSTMHVSRFLINDIKALDTVNIIRHKVPDIYQSRPKVDIPCPVITSTVNLLVSNADLVRPGTKNVKPVPLSCFYLKISYAWFTPMRSVCSTVKYCRLLCQRNECRRLDFRLHLRAMDSLYENRRSREQSLLATSTPVTELVTIHNEQLLGGGGICLCMDAR